MPRRFKRSFGLMARMPAPPGHSDRRFTLRYMEAYEIHHDVQPIAARQDVRAGRKTFP